MNKWHYGFKLIEYYKANKLIQLVATYSHTHTHTHTLI